MRSDSRSAFLGSNGWMSRPTGSARRGLGGLHEEVHADAEEERQPRREGVDVEALGLGGADVFEPVRKSECQLLDKRRSRLLHVIAGDRDRVELGHVLRGVLDDVGHDAHGGSGG